MILRSVFLAIMFGALSSSLVGAQAVLDRQDLVRQLEPITGNDERSVDLYILFALGSHELSEKAGAQLGELSAALMSDELAPHDVRIVGHTDAVGSAKSNQELSERRAQSVVNYLLEADIASARLTAFGRGESNLLSNLAPDDGRNRRVEVIVIRKTDKDMGKSDGHTPIN